jgi:glycosyltransferase involved in cell wall biosynthesis
MRITFVLPTVNMTGGIRVVAIYAKALAEKGHDVALVSPAPRPISFRQKIKSFLSGKGWPAESGKMESHLDGLNLNHKQLDNWRAPKDVDVPDADVIVATWWETAEWVVNLSARKGAKVYFIQHYEIHPYLPVDRCKATYRLPMHKIVIARWLKNIMENEYEDSQMDLVPNSVDHSLFFASDRGKQLVPTVGFLYSKSSYKGVDVTLQVIALLRQRFPDLRVISFGSAKPDWDNENGIEFSYSPPQESLRGLYAQCDLWITASRAEGYNLPAMEAMACRTPVLSTKTGWPEEAVVTGKNGALVEVDDVNALFENAVSILSLPDEEWRAISRNAYETVKDSSWALSAGMFENALLHACERARKGEIAGHCQ